MFQNHLFNDVNNYDYVDNFYSTIGYDYESEMLLRQLGIHSTSMLQNLFIDCLDNLEGKLSDKEFNDKWIVTDNLFNNNTIEQMDEPEKPVIPKFVADWIEIYRKKTLVELINDAVYSSDEDSKCFRRWFHEEMGFDSNYSEFLSRTWLDGYEAEKEKKWVVKQRKLYLKSFDIWREECNNAEFVFDKESTIKFTDKVKAEAVALLVDGTVEEVTE